MLNAVSQSFISNSLDHQLEKLSGLTLLFFDCCRKVAKKYLRPISVLLLAVAGSACLSSAVMMRFDMGNGRAVNDPDRSEGAPGKTGHSGLRLIRTEGRPMLRSKQPASATANFRLLRDDGAEAGFGVPMVWHEEGRALQVAAYGAGLD